jgi:hypothetical protein
MMSAHRYRLALVRIPAEGEDRSQGAPSLAFEFESHDEVFELLARPGHPELGEEDRRELVVGLKLLGGVMLRNRELPMFRELQPHFGAFMKALKGGGKKGPGGGAP